MTLLQKDFPLVTSALSGVPVLTPGELDATYAVGRTLYEAGDYGRALDVFRLVALCNPKSVRSWFALASCHEALGEDEQAVSLFELAAVFDDDEELACAARLYAARLHVALGAVEAAQEQFEEASRTCAAEYGDVARAVEAAIKRGARR